MLFQHSNATPTARTAKIVSLVFTAHLATHVANHPALIVLMGLFARAVLPTIPSTPLITFASFPIPVTRRLVLPAAETLARLALLDT